MVANVAIADQNLKNCVESGWLREQNMGTTGEKLLLIQRNEKNCLPICSQSVTVEMSKHENLRHTIKNAQFSLLNAGIKPWLLFYSF